MNLFDPDDGPEGSGRIVTGTEFGRLLVHRTRAHLEEMYGETTDDDVASYLGTTREKIDEVMTTRAVFGLEFFEKLAASNHQTAPDFVRDLIRWKLVFEETK